MPGVDHEFVLAHEWVVSLWVPQRSDADAVVRLVGETGTALALAVDDLSRVAADGDGPPRRLTLDR
jgi:hypothetical protein